LFLRGETYLHTKIYAGNMSEKALRYNEGKLDWTLVDWKSLEPLVKVVTYGWKKYTTPEASGRDNWKNPCEDPMQHIQSAFRHLMAISGGEMIDPESNELHAGHVCANMMMFIYHTNKKIVDGFNQNKSVPGFDIEKLEAVIDKRISNINDFHKPETEIPQGTHNIKPK